ncbi:MAG: ATP-binding cassette subfamily B protein RaxB [Oceanicoccus sp.]
MNIFSSALGLKKNPINIIPLIKQKKPGQDGLSCIAMMLSLQSKEKEFRRLCIQYPQHVKGMNLQSIIDIFKTYNIASRGLHCSVRDLSKLHLPCIVHWKMNQFVVLVSIDNNNANIRNPASKKSEYSIAEFEHNYCDIALEIISY